MNKSPLFIILAFSAVLLFLLTNNNGNPDNGDVHSIKINEEKLSTPKNSNYQLLEKIHLENYLAAEAETKLTRLNEKEIIKQLKNKGIYIDERLARRADQEEMTSKDLEWLQTVIAANLSEEENFKVDVTKYNSFKDIKNSYIERSKATGLFYGNDILNTPGIYRDADINDISAILEEGATFPDDVMLHMIAHNNTDLALKIKEQGYNLNVNYYDQLTTMGLMEIQIQKIVWDPMEMPIERQFNTIDSLIRLGVPVKERDGTRDALDRSIGAAAITEDPIAARYLMLISKKLNDSGITLESSHMELLEKLKAIHPDLYEEFIHLFK